MFILTFYNININLLKSDWFFLSFFLSLSCLYLVRSVVRSWESSISLHEEDPFFFQHNHKSSYLPNKKHTAFLRIFIPLDVCFFFFSLMESSSTLQPMPITISSFPYFYGLNLWNIYRSFQIYSPWVSLELDFSFFHACFISQKIRSFLRWSRKEDYVCKGRSGSIKKVQP